MVLYAELVHLVGKYGLDSNDAVILMEAQRCGVADIVTVDRDLLRAPADFTIYTWLRSAIRRKVSAVAGSAGKKDSIASSARVTSSGVPKTVVV